MADSQAIARELKSVLRALERERDELDDKIRLMKRTLEGLASVPKAGGEKKSRGAKKKTSSRGKSKASKKAGAKTAQSRTKKTKTKAKTKKSSSRRRSR